MTKLEDMMMTIENKMLSVGLNLNKKVTTILGKIVLQFAEVKNTDELFGDAKLALEELHLQSQTIAYIDGRNRICITFDNPDK